MISHEIAHVLQQRAAGGESAVAPWGLFEWLIDKVADFLRGFATYRSLTVVLGRDPLSGEPIALTPDQRIAELIRLAGFPAAAAIVEELAIISTVGEIVGRALRERNLTVDRVLGDLRDAATDPASAGDLVRRLFSDAMQAIAQAGGQIIAHVRTVLAPHIEKSIASNPRTLALWRLASGVLHYDVLRAAQVERSTEQLLVDFFTFIDKPQVIEQMRERGTLQKTVEWLDAKLVELAAIKDQVVALVTRVWDALSFENLGELPTTIGSLITEALGILERIVAFGARLVLDALLIFKDSLLALASEYASRVPGFGVIRVLLGRDPFTQVAVPHGTLELLQELTKLFADDATYAALNDSGRLAEAAANIEAAIEELGITPAMVLQAIAGVWNLVTWESLLHPIDTFAAIIAQFGDPLARIIRFTLIVVREIIGVIVVGMGFPADVVPRILENIGQALTDIKRDPVGFLMNLVQTLVLGFEGFVENIGTHLLSGFTSWLLRGVRALGITVPDEITLQSAITLVLDVLGLSLDLLWKKLGERIGPERVEMLRAAPEKLEQAFAFIKGVEEGGIGFLWEQLSEKLSNIWDQLFDAAMTWITETVVKIAVAQVVALLAIPGLGAVIGAVQTVVAAMQTLVEYLTDIVNMLDQIAGTIAEIARGDLSPSAKGVEAALADALPFAIGFLANYLHLGDLPEKLKEVIESLRAVVDAAIDWLLDKAIALAKSVLETLTGGKKPEESAAAPAGPADPAAPGALDVLIDVPGDQHHIRDDGPGGELMLHSKAQRIAELAALKDLAVQYMAANAITGANAVEKAGANQDDEAKKIMAKLRAAIRAMGESGVLFSPGKSGVGIGDVLAHGAQDQRTRATGSEVTHILSTESEHVIPFAVGQSLWTSMLQEKAKPRKDLSARDHAQTTIVIYFSAARLKTAGTSTSIDLGGDARDFVRAMERAGGSDTEAIAQAKAAPTTARPATAAALKKAAKSKLRAAATSGIARTVTAVEQEHALLEKRGVYEAELANGVRRGEGTPTPAKTLIEKAAEEQQEVLIKLLLETFA